MRGEIVSLDERRQGAQQRRAEEELRAKVPERFAGCFAREDEWLRVLAAKVRAEIDAWSLSPEQIIEVAALVDRLLSGR